MYDLDLEIQKLFDLVDGKIISYDIDSGWSSEKVEKGRQIYLTISTYIKDVTTDKGEVYEVGFFAYIIYEDEEEMVGISSLKVRGADKTIYSVGEP